jgi:antitoxin VapB
MAEELHARVFWSGGSQAVRLPKSLRVEGDEVRIRRRGNAIVIEPLRDDGWDDFWERLLPLREPIKRGRVRAAERREPI